MKVSELINALKGHEDKRIGAAFIMDKDGSPHLAVGPFEIIDGGDEGIALVPLAFVSQEPEPKPGMSKALLEKLIPRKHLRDRFNDPNRMASGPKCQLERIHEDVNEIVKYLEEHNLMEEINRRSGQANDIRYMAYAIQAYYMRVLK